MYIEEIIDCANECLKKLEGKKIIIWGASEYTIKLFQYSNIANYNVQGIVDNYKSGEFLFGKQVMNPADVKWNEVEAVIPAGFYREKEILEELSAIYKYDGLVVSLNMEGQDKPFYHYLLKRDMKPSPEYVECLKRNTIFKDRHKGERVFILACGPSINQMDLTKLKNEYAIAFSSFFLHKDIRIINPKYYVAAAWIHCVPADTIQPWVDWVYRTIPDTTMFRDVLDKKYIEEGRETSPYPIFYFETLGIERDRPYDAVELDRKIMAPQTASIVCIQIAMYMGFKEIYLVGTEHDTICHGKYEHFYEYGKYQIPEDRQRADGTLDSPFKVELRNTAIVWQQYTILKEIADKCGIKIYNATVGGVLDVFDRVDYESLF